MNIQVLLTALSGRLAALAAVAASAGALAGFAAPASAGLGIACPDPTARIFQPWGDYFKYAFAPNGGFESGAAGWTLTGGAKVAAGNETFKVHGSRDAYSLALPSGSSATTAPMCIGLLSGHMRFFSANAGAANSRLRVQVLYAGGVGGILGSVAKLLGVADIGYVKSGAPWQPSQSVKMLGGTLPLLTAHVQFRFTPADTAGKWQIDDVYLDPLMHG